MTILSYESLFSQWIQSRELKKLILTGKNLKYEKDGFLFDEPMSLIISGAESNDFMCFYSVLSSYEPHDIECFEGEQLKEPFLGIFEDYKDSRLTSVQQKMTELIFSKNQPSLFF